MTLFRIAWLCLLLPATLSAQSQNELGARLNYHTVFLHDPDSSGALSSLSRSGFQMGLFLKAWPQNRVALRAEVNYSLMGYTIEGDKISYHYLGVAAMPDIRLADMFSVGLGGFANFLFIDPGDFPPQLDRNKLDAGPLASAFLRYDKIEIQARYQMSLTAFSPKNLKPNLYFRAVSVGLAYYFR